MENVYRSLIGCEWSHKILSFNQAYIDKRTSKVDRMIEEREQLSVTRNESKLQFLEKLLEIGLKCYFYF